MTSEAARAKAIQVTAITLLIKPLIDKGYENYKLLHLVTFDHKKDSYDQTVKHTNDIVLHTSSGKSQVALSKTLDELIRDSSTITNGINSILINTKDYSTNFLDTQNKPANMIELLDAFESTKGTLSSTIFKLESLKRLNNSLLPDMTDIYNDVINTLAIRFYLVSRPEIEAIAISQGLLPTDNIELASIDESNTYIDKSIQTVEKTTIDIQTYFNDMHQKDRLVALSFNVGPEGVYSPPDSPTDFSQILDQIMNALSGIMDILEAIFKHILSPTAESSANLRALLNDPRIIELRNLGKKMGVVGALIAALFVVVEDLANGENVAYAFVHALLRVVAEWGLFEGIVAVFTFIGAGLGGGVISAATFAAFGIVVATFAVTFGATDEWLADQITQLLVDMGLIDEEEAQKAKDDVLKDAEEGNPEPDESYAVPIPKNPDGTPMYPDGTFPPFLPGPPPTLPGGTTPPGNPPDSAQEPPAPTLPGGTTPPGLTPPEEPDYTPKLP